MGSTMVENPSGFICSVCRLDIKDLGAAGAQTQLEPKNQIGQLFGRQPDDGRVGRNLTRKCLGRGCASMREACSQLAAACRGAGRSMHAPARNARKERVFARRVPLLEPRPY